MAEMAKYCRAYLAKQLRQFEGWTENLDSLRQEAGDDGEPGEQRTEIHDDDILYVQDSYLVTDDVFKDEHIIFDQVTDAWKAFCTETLEFEIPVYEPIPMSGSAEASS